MKEFFPLLRQCALFEGIDPADMGGLLSCLGAKLVTVKKNAVVWAEGDPASHLGIVLTGAVQTVKDDFFGNRSIVDQAEPGELFAESYAAGGMTALPVSIIAVRESQLLLIDCRRITVSCANACGFHSQMIHNLLRVVAEKNLQYNQKLEITGKRTTREKVMAYLTAQAKQAGQNSFTIPFDRQGLADYLGVERSAMSAEIGKLRKEGILSCQRSHFTLL